MNEDGLSDKSDSQGSNSRRSNNDNRQSYLMQKIEGMNRMDIGQQKMNKKAKDRNNLALVRAQTFDIKKQSSLAVPIEEGDQTTKHQPNQNTLKKPVMQHIQSVDKRKLFGAKTKA